jgi:hypothetical protein
VDLLGWNVGTRAAMVGSGAAIDMYAETIHIVGVGDPFRIAWGTDSQRTFVMRLNQHRSAQTAYRLGWSEPGRGNAIAVDHAGGFFAVGSTVAALGKSNRGGKDAFVVRYAPDGCRAWVRQFGTATTDVANAVAADVDGNCYVVGHSCGDFKRKNIGKEDIFVVKYSPAGDRMWRHHTGSSAGDIARGVAVDNAGNCYVVGFTRGAFGSRSAGQEDAFVLKLNSTGSEEWITQFGTRQSDAALAVGVDTNGYCYVAGCTDGNLGAENAGYDDAFLAKFDSSGQQLWTRQLGTERPDCALGLWVGKKGTCYLAGSTEGNLGGPNRGMSDVFAASYSSQGRRKWIRQNGSSEPDYGHGIAVSALGRCYVTGSTLGATTQENAFMWQVPPPK